MMWIALCLIYYRFSHAELMYKTFSEQVKAQYPIDIPKDFIREFVLKQIEENINTMLSSASLKPEIHQLLSDDSLSLKEQEKFLKGMVLTPIDILWLNKDAQELGCLLDIYHEETYPIKFYEKKTVVFNQKTIEVLS